MCAYMFICGTRIAAGTREDIPYRNRIFAGRLQPYLSKPYTEQRVIFRGGLYLITPRTPTARTLPHAHAHTCTPRDTTGPGAPWQLGHRGHTRTVMSPSSAWLTSQLTSHAHAVRVCPNRTLAATRLHVSSLSHTKARADLRLRRYTCTSLLSSLQSAICSQLVLWDSLEPGLLSHPLCLRASGRILLRAPIRAELRRLHRQGRLHGPSLVDGKGGVLGVLCNNRAGLQRTCAAFATCSTASTASRTAFCL